MDSKHAKAETQTARSRQRADEGMRLAPRGLRIPEIAAYTGLSPFFFEELIRGGKLPSLDGPGSGVCAAHIVLREHVDRYLDILGQEAEKRAAKRREASGVAD